MCFSKGSKYKIDRLSLRILQSHVAIIFPAPGWETYYIVTLYTIWLHCVSRSLPLYQVSYAQFETCQFIGILSFYSLFFIRSSEVWFLARIGKFVIYLIRNPIMMYPLTKLFFLVSFRRATSLVLSLNATIARSSLFIVLPLDASDISFA